MIRIGKMDIHRSVSQRNSLINLMDKLAAALLVSVFIFSAAALGASETQKRDSGKLGPFLFKLVKEYEHKGLEQAEGLASRRGMKLRSLQRESYLPVIL